MNKPSNVDEYISNLMPRQAEAAAIIRKLIWEMVPEATEEIGYGMPAYKLQGKRLLYFAAFPKHIGFYPLPHTIETLKNELKKYKQGKGSIQFPLDKPMPIELIKKIIIQRMNDLQ